MQQKLFQFFLPQETGAFGNKIEKELQETMPKIEKIYLLYIYGEYFLFCSPMQVVVFLQKCFNFVE